MDDEVGILRMNLSHRSSHSEASTDGERRPTFAVQHTKFCGKYNILGRLCRRRCRCNRPVACAITAAQIVHQHQRPRSQAREAESWPTTFDCGSRGHRRMHLAPGVLPHSGLPAEAAIFKSMQVDCIYLLFDDVRSQVEAALNSLRNVSSYSGSTEDVVRLSMKMQRVRLGHF